MRTLFVDTPFGRLGFFYRGWSGRPLAVMVHGFAQAAEGLFGWEKRLAGHDVVFGCLPEHGDAPPIEGGLHHYIRAFRSALTAFPAPVDLVIGESLGGLIALTIKARLIVAADPFLTTKKLWPVHSIFGSPSWSAPKLKQQYIRLLRDADYRDVIPMIVSPALLLAGDQPLMPPRLTQTAPSLLDDEDERLFCAHPLVHLRRLSGGNDLLRAHADECAQIILSRLEEPSPPMR